MANAASVGQAQLASLQRVLRRPGLVRWYRPLLIGLSVGGAIFGVGSILWGYGLGMWPPHDTSAYWLAGRHILEGKPVYDGGSSWYLAFLYPPPVAIVLAPLSLLQYDLFSLALVGLQIGALRYVTGSWIAVGLLGWIPGVHYEFVAGNVNCLMAAAMYATLTGRRYSGVALAVFGLAKFAPVLVLLKASRRQWIEFALTFVVLLAISLPWLYLWPEWVTKLQVRDPYVGIAPLFIRLPIAAALLLYRRPWSVAAGAALATPIFYEQSVVLLLPAIRLWWDARRVSTTPEATTPEAGDQLAAADGRPAAAGVSSRGRTADAPSS